MPIPVILGGAMGSAAVGVIVRIFIGTMIARIVMSLGLAYVTFEGMDIAFETFYSMLDNYKASLTADLVSIMDRLGIFVAIQMVVSTISAVMTYKIATKAFSNMTFGNFS